MAKVVNQRSGTNSLPNFFSKVNTDGDAHRFLGAEAGTQSVQTVVLDSTGSAEVLLDFNYLVGVSQLRVYQELTVNAVSFWSPILLEGLDASATVYFTEDSGTRVTITGAANTTQRFMFDVPHTSIPAELREKVMVRDQGDNDAIELLGNGDGIMFHSSSGFKFLVRMDDSGNLVTEAR